MHSKNRATEIMAQLDSLSIETTMGEIQKKSTDFHEKPSCLLWDKAIHTRPIGINEIIFTLITEN